MTNHDPRGEHLTPSELEKDKVGPCGRPDDEHGRTSRLEQLRWGQIVAAAGGMWAIPYCLYTVADPGSSVIIRVLAWGPAALSVGYFVLDLLFQRLRRRLRRMTSSSQATPGWRPPPRPEIGSEPQPLKIRFRKPPAIADEETKQYRRVTERSNVMGRPPLCITYFRCFANPARTRTFLEGAWNEFGYVHMLRNPNSATWRELWRSRDTETMAELVITTEAQLGDRLRCAPTEPNKWSAKPYGEYPVREFFCGDGFWQQAANQLIEIADLVVIDLSGHARESLGLQFELECAFTTKRLDQVLLLADELSDREYLATQIRWAWASTPASGDPARVHVYILDKVVTELVVVPGGGPGEVHFGRDTRLYSDRSESRRLLSHVLDRTGASGSGFVGPHGESCSRTFPGLGG
ncbi:hypothetical protein [Amycolatopsis sp. Hca4]|uniref:hypothetical protein n=1 Tax=Amycolatopsis sp. Hca4 TaxID=2742131 RepID=UPI0015908C9E|nr:hypothetical protein [Amycolatopsis sp. Hca4]QKV73970.1 hypothetical protein HUT10_09455 [Amycolatopsis sp. Hca4]